MTRIFAFFIGCAFGLVIAILWFALAAIFIGMDITGNDLVSQGTTIIGFSGAIGSFFLDEFLD